MGPPIDETNDAGIPDSAPPRHIKQTHRKGAWGRFAPGPLRIPWLKWQKQQSPESRYVCAKVCQCGREDLKPPCRGGPKTRGGAGKVGADQIPEPPFSVACFPPKSPERGTEGVGCCHFGVKWGEMGCKTMQLNRLDRNVENRRIHCENAFNCSFSRLWCSGDTRASQNLGGFRFGNRSVQEPLKLSFCHFESGKSSSDEGVTQTR